MATLESLKARIAKLQAQAEAIVKKDSSAVIEKIRGIMEKHGITTADIDAHIGGGAKKRGRKPGVKAAAKSSASAAKYRDPKTGATWTGHGRAPAWIASAKDRSKFLVEGNAVAAPAPAAKRAARIGRYVRGPQPALYADPKTGVTWSGRGRAPAWIAQAKDRTKFLIASGDAKTSLGAAGKTKPSAKKAVTKRVVVKLVAGTKTAPTSKVTAKKVVAKKAVSAKVPARKAPTKDTPRQSMAEPAPVTSVEPSAESAT